MPDQGKVRSDLVAQKVAKRASFPRYRLTPPSWCEHPSESVVTKTKTIFGTITICRLCHGLLRVG